MNEEWERPTGSAREIAWEQGCWGKKQGVASDDLLMCVLAYAQQHLPAETPLANHVAQEGIYLPACLSNTPQGQGWSRGALGGAGGCQG